MLENGTKLKKSQMTVMFFEIAASKNTEIIGVSSNKDFHSRI